MRMFCKGALALLVMAAAACGGGDGGSLLATTTAPGATTTSGASTTTNSPGTTSSRATTTTGLRQNEGEQVATAALLTVAELPQPEGFEEGPSSMTPSPPLCGGTVEDDPDNVIPPAVLVHRVLQNESVPAALQQAIRIYADAEEAQRAFELGSQGLDCSEGSTEVDGMQTTVQITELGDLSQQLETDKATAWGLSTDQLEVALIAARYRAAVITFNFQTTMGTDTSSIGDPLEIAQIGMEKVRNT